ncbi:MAG TPA: chloride channel protein [Iamia sp.]
MRAVALPESVRSSLPSSFSLLVVAAGVAGGIVGAAYLGVLMVAEHLLGPEQWADGAHIVVLVATGLAVAAIVHVVGPTSNVELLVDDIHVVGGRHELRTLRSLIPVSLLCVGAGGTLGPEAPLVQTTGALGGRIAHRFGLDQRRLRILTITGMAAGFTALFGSPIGATVFALEIPHRRGIEHSDAILPASVGAMAGYAVYVVASGNGLRPIFDLPGVTELRAVDLAWAALAGVLSAIVAYAFALGVSGARRVARAIPPPARPALGGLALGLLALGSPHALTNGELALHDLTTGKLAVGALLLAAGAKLAGAIVAVAGEWRGGFIIPLFFIGACVGSAVFVIAPSANQWVLVTAMMAGCNVGVTKTPLGSALVVSEMAGIRLLPTILVASLVALALTGPLRVIETQRSRHEAEARP